MTSKVAVDTSALVAMMWEEREAAWFGEALGSVDERVMSAGTLQEFILVVGDRERRYGRSPERIRAACHEFVAGLGIAVLPITSTLALIGAAGVLRYRIAPAKLNFGDGFAYALAKHHDIPLLCKGNDFPHTDIEVMQPPAS